MEWKRRLTIAGIAVGVFAGYRYLLPAAIPFILAWVLACWLYPAAVRIEKRIKIKRSLAGGILLAVLLCAAAVLIYLGIRELLMQVRTAVENVPILMKWCENMLDGFCTFLENTAGIKGTVSRPWILKQVSGIGENFIAVFGKGTAGYVFSCARNILFIISGTVVTFISCILIIGDMENIRKKIWDYSWLVGTRRVVRRLQGTTVAYLKAQVVIIICVAAVCAVGFWIMGSPYFLIFGIALGVFDALPLIGTGAFLYPGALVLLIRGKAILALGCVLLDIITSVLREVLEPKLLGHRLGFSPVMMLVFVYAGVFLFGVWGVLLGPLAFSTAYEIGREWDIWD